MEREKSNDENIYRCKFIVKPIELHFKGKRITFTGIDEIKEYIRLTVWRGTEDHTKGTNGNKMDMNDTENLKREREITILD